MGSKQVTRHKQSVAQLAEILLSVSWKLQYIAWYNNVYDVKIVGPQYPRIVVFSSC
jgi:hypothetical protein